MFLSNSQRRKSKKYIKEKPGAILLTGFIHSGEQSRAVSEVKLTIIE